MKFLVQRISRCEFSISSAHVALSKDASVENAQIFSVDAHLPVSDKYKPSLFLCLFLYLPPPHYCNRVLKVCGGIVLRY